MFPLRSHEARGTSLVFSLLLSQTGHSTRKTLLENRTVDIVERILET